MIWMITSVNTQTLHETSPTADALPGVTWTGPRGYWMSLITSFIAEPFCMSRRLYRLTRHPARMIYEPQLPLPTRYPCLCTWNGANYFRRCMEPFRIKKGIRVDTHRWCRVPYTVRVNVHISVSEDVHTRWLIHRVYNGQTLFIAILSQWVGRGGPPNWPHKSPDFIFLEVHPWG
jgi:hypothetical protein